MLFSLGSINDQIKSILTGKPYGVTGVVMTEDLLRKNAVTAAKGVYGHLIPQLDAGLTIDDIFGSYRSNIARTLEMTESSIDFSDPKFAKFLGNAKDGQMSLAAAISEVKNNPDYNYGMTRQANQSVDKMAIALERIFGKVR